MQENLVSIITPCHNASKFVAETIESVLSQTYSEWEMLIVDDCSTDNSVEIVQSFSEQDSRIKLLKLEKNSGAAVARNCGIKEARGRYIAFIDSDDIWLDNKLQQEMDFMKDKNCAFVYTATQMIDADGEKKGKFTPVPEKTDYNHLLKRTVIATSTVLLDRKVTGNFFMPLRRSGQDYATWLMLLRNIDFAYGINQPLCLYRISPKSLSSNKLKSIKQVFDIQTKNEKISKPYAAFNTFCFCLYAFKKHFLN